MSNPRIFIQVKTKLVDDRRDIDDWQKTSSVPAVAIFDVDSVIGLIQSCDLEADEIDPGQCKILFNDSSSLRVYQPFDKVKNVLSRYITIVEV